MPALSARSAAAALLGYVLVALLFAWPLPLHLTNALLGAPGGDTGVYAWNLWVFRHEIVVNGRMPFFTDQILSATPAVPLTLHNYTTAANVVALPLQPLLGTVGTFNLLILASGVLSAYVMFLFLRETVGDPAAAWLGGLLYGFSPFMTARQMAHFSLVQAAAIPAFALVLHRFQADAPTLRRAAAAGAIIAWAYLSDPYYAVYCALMAAFFIGWEAIALERRTASVPFPLRTALDLTITIVAGLVVAILVRGGGELVIAGVRVSMTRLYTPVLVLTVLVAARAWITRRSRVVWRIAPLKRYVVVGIVGSLTCVALMAPLLTSLGRHIGDEQWIAPPVFWRSSAPGMDLLAFAVPNPVGTLTGWVASDWLRRMPDGLYENVAAIPWTVFLAVAIGIGVAGARVPRYWAVFTGAALVLALGPFVHIAGVNTHIPTPWVLLRYLPVVGAARMPTRLTILVMLGAAVIFAVAVKAMRERAVRPWIPAAVAGACLLAELCPAPRTLFPVEVPEFYRTIAADPRPVTVMHLPFGLRDGVSSAGDFSAHAQFLQIFHGKRLLGGYLSRLPKQEVARYRQLPLMRVLLDLSEGLEVTAEQKREALASAPAVASRLDLGYVVVDNSRAAPELVAFATDALNLQPVASAGAQELYAVP